jgi:hypothetical protein
VLGRPLRSLCITFFGCWRSTVRMGYEAKKRAIAGVLVSFFNKVARLMERCQYRKDVVQRLPKSQLSACAYAEGTQQMAVCFSLKEFVMQGASPMACAATVVAAVNQPSLGARAVCPRFF